MQGNNAHIPINSNQKLKNFDDENIVFERPTIENFIGVCVFFFYINVKLSITSEFLN